MSKNFLPPQFDEIANKVGNFICVSENEYHGACPKCGGRDRFVMWAVSKGGYPLGWCRQCDYRWFPHMERRPSAKELEEWRVRQIEIEEARKADAERSLILLNSEKMWERFFAANNDYSRQLYRERGFSEEWIKYLQFGLNPDYTVKYKADGEWMEYHSPALSLPIWGANVVQNVKLRVTCPKSPGDRYRNLYDAAGGYLYQPIHDVAIGNKVIVCEGEFKAGRMAQELDRLGEGLALRPVGVQSKKPNPLVYEVIKNVELVYLWLDQDAFEKEKKESESAVEYNVRVLGKERVRIVQCPVKSDDGINEGMNPMNFIRMARKA